MLLDEFFCCSAKSMEVLQPSTVDDGRHMEEPIAPNAEQAQVRVDPVALTVEQPTVAEPTAPYYGGALNNWTDLTWRWIA